MLVFSGFGLGFVLVWVLLAESGDLVVGVLGLGFDGGGFEAFGL